jgi:hypothetical protein
MEEKAMYSRTILLAGASVAGAANATPVNLCQSAVARIHQAPGEIDSRDGALMGEILI